MKQILEHVPDIKFLHRLKPLFAHNSQFGFNFFYKNWSQFGFIEPKSAHDLRLVEREIIPD